MSEQLTFAIVLGAALVDSINPCAIGVILFLSTVLLRTTDNRRFLLKMGSIYVATVYVVYVLSGLGLIWFQHQLVSSGYAEVVGISVGALIILLGLVEIKDFFWYGRGFSLEILDRHKDRIVKLSSNLSLAGIIGLGAFVAMVELPCTGGPYLAITAILARSFDLLAFTYLMIYNAIFVLPLIVIVIVICFGGSTAKMKKWRTSNRKWMNLAAGMMMIGLGALLIAYYRQGWYL